jgi:DNA primase
LINFNALDGALEVSKHRSNNPDEHIYLCPFCNLAPYLGADKSGHLYVNVNKAVFHCFKCGEKGPLQKLYKLLKLEYVEGLYSQSFKEAENTYFDPILKRQIVLNPERIEDISVDLDYSIHILATEYLEKRGITEDMVELYGLRLGVKRWAGRIIIPVYYNGVVSHWTGRSYTGSPMRYKCSLGTKLGVFNLERAKDYDDVIITEGPFSALACGDNAVALEGKTNTILPLVEYPFKKFIVCLDGDATEDTIKVARALYRMGKNVYAVRLPDGKDPGDLGIENMKTVIKEAEPFRSEIHFRISKWN